MTLHYEAEALLRIPQSLPGLLKVPNLILVNIFDPDFDTKKLKAEKLIYITVQKDQQINECDQWISANDS